MTDQKNPQGKPVEAASAAPGEQRSTSRPLARASESGDPAVHKALADLQAAQMNQATHADLAESSAEAAKGHEETVKKAKDALADLGYE
jgi:hypothetical protein